MYKDIGIEGLHRQKRGLALGRLLGRLSLRLPLRLTSNVPIRPFARLQQLKKTLVEL